MVVGMGDCTKGRVEKGPPRDTDGAATRDPWDQVACLLSAIRDHGGVMSTQPSSIMRQRILMARGAKESHLWAAVKRRGETRQGKPLNAKATGAQWHPGANGG